MTKANLIKVRQGALIIALFSVLSKVLGLLRDRLLASKFGASELTDVYFAAFKIPDFVFNLLVLGSLSAAFVPVFLDYYQLNQKTKTSFNKESLLITNTLVTGLGLSLMVLSLGLFFAMPQLIRWLTPGFTANQILLTISFSRVMLISTFLLSLSSILSGVLQSLQLFISFALAPVFYNLGIIIGIVGLTSWLGPIGLAWGVVLGAFGHFLVQLITVWRVGFRYQFILKTGHQGVRKIIKLLFPRTFSLGFAQLNQLLNTWLASSMAVGSLSVFTFANNLQAVPLSVFAISLSVAVFPNLTECFLAKDQVSFKKVLLDTWEKILFFLIPLTVFMIILRAQIVRVLLGGGLFNWSATISVLETFAILVFSLVFQASTALLTRAFFARQNTKTPVLASVIGVVVNISLAMLFTLKLGWGVSGLALAFSVASLVHFLILIFFLTKVSGPLGLLKFSLKLLWLSVFSALSGLVLYTTLAWFASLWSTDTWLNLVLQAGLATLTGSIVYLGLVLIFTKYPGSD